jgi:Tol biopolymer transport system component
MVCDTYPLGTDRLQELFLYHVETGARIDLGAFHAADRFTGDIRCDLHPRWSPDGKTISIDSVHEGSRQIYLVDVSEAVLTR